MMFAGEGGKIGVRNQEGSQRRTDGDRRRKNS